VERGHDDHEALEPHADVDHERDHEHHRDAGAQLLEPEQLGRDDVAGTMSSSPCTARTPGSEREHLVRSRCTRR
jgi:hypothetical protein